MGAAPMPRSRRSGRLLRTWIRSCKRTAPSAISAHRSPTEVQSGVFNLIETTHVYTGSYQQGLPRRRHRLGQLQRALSERKRVQRSAQSHGRSQCRACPCSKISCAASAVAANARTITVSRMNLNTTELNFKTQVISVVTQVLNAYYNLAADYEDLRAKRSASETAQTFVNDAKRQIEIGSVAPTDLITAETTAASSAQAVVDSNVALQQQELSLKNLISRTGPADPVLANVRIVPIDSIAIPATDNLLPIDQMVRQALANRADLASELAGEKANEVNSLGTKNGILPTLDGFVVESAGRTGRRSRDRYRGRTHRKRRISISRAASATRSGKCSAATFPPNRRGAFYQEPLRNRQAQADYSIDLLQLRQTQLTNRKDFNQVEVDVRNGVVALQQARARFDAALKNRELQQELFDAEEKRFRLGASTPYNVALQQRDLISAQSSAVAALVAYSTARVSLDQTLGNHTGSQSRQHGRSEERKDRADFVASGQRAQALTAAMGRIETLDW